MPLVAALIEEAMPAAFVEVEVAAVAGGFHAVGELTDAADEVVVGADHDQRRRGLRVDVIGGEESASASTPMAKLPPRFSPGISVAAIERGGGVVEDHRVRHGADGGVFVRFVEFLDRPCRGGEMAAGRAAAGDDAIGIDAELGGVARTQRIADLASRTQSTPFTPWRLVTR